MKMQKYIIFCLLMGHSAWFLYSSEENKQSEKHVHFSDDTKTTDDHKVLNLRLRRIQKEYYDDSDEEIAGFAYRPTENCLNLKKYDHHTFMHSGGFDCNQRSRDLQSREIDDEIFLGKWNAAREKELCEQNKDSSSEDDTF